MFIDVGANNGIYSIIAAVIRPDIRVMAFEPYPPVIELLRRNILINGLDRRVEIVECALSDQTGQSTIFLPDQGHGLIETSASLQEDFIVGAQPATTVATRRLDDIELGQTISVAKIGIEGYELEFIRGAQETITRDRPVLFAEMLGPAQKNSVKLPIG